MEKKAFIVQSGTILEYYDSYKLYTEWSVEILKPRNGYIDLQIADGRMYMKWSKWFLTAIRTTKGKKSGEVDSLHSTKPKLRCYAGSTNPALRVSEICDDDNLWQWSRLEIILNAFCRPTIPQKWFIIVNWFSKIYPI